MLAKRGRSLRMGLVAVFLLGAVLIASPVSTVKAAAPYTKYVTAQAIVAAGQIGSATATCPEGSVVVGGGFASSSSVLFYTHFKAGNGWRGYAKNNAGISWRITVYAACLFDAPGASSTQVVNQITVQPGEFAHATVACPEGSILTHGSWATQADGSQKIWASTKYNDYSQYWVVESWNKSDSKKLLNVYAICLSGVEGKTTSVIEYVTIPANTTGRAATPACDRDQLVTGGGFITHLDLVIYNSSGPHGGDQWWVYAKNPTNADRWLHGYAVCLTLQ
ncbi:MAG: hypothetical protein ACK2US_04140 [Anaerolineae bacterium]|jgi:hypothetical protein